MYEYANDNKLKVYECITVDHRLNTSTENNLITEFIDSMEKEDTVIISRYLDLGSTVGEALSVMDQMMLKRINIVAIQEKNKNNDCL